MKRITPSYVVQCQHSVPVLPRSTSSRALGVSLAAPQERPWQRARRRRPCGRRTPPVTAKHGQTCSDTSSRPRWVLEAAHFQPGLGGERGEEGLVGCTLLQGFLLSIDVALDVGQLRAQLLYLNRLRHCTQMIISVVQQKLCVSMSCCGRSSLGEYDASRVWQKQLPPCFLKAL